MNKKQLLLTATAAITALLASCSDNVVEAGDQSVQSTAKLNAVVFDAVTNMPLEGAKISIVGTANKATTNSKGFAYVGEARIGTQALLVEKDNYAAFGKGVEIEGNGKFGVSIAEEQTVQVFLSPLTAKAEGLVYYQGKDGGEFPASGAKVVIKCFAGSDYPGGEGTLFITPDTAVVGADGKYAFSNLPAGARLELTFLSFKAKDGRKFDEFSFDYENIPFTGTAIFEPQAYNSDGFLASVPFVVGYGEAPSFDGSITSGAGEIKVVFSEPMDISEGLVASPAGANVIWNATKDTLTLVFEGLELKSGFSLELRNMRSANWGRLSDFSRTVTINPIDIRTATVAVTAVTVTDPSAPLTAAWADLSLTATVEWSKLEGAVMYEIWAKADKGNGRWYKIDSDVSADNLTACPAEAEKCSFAGNITMSNLGFSAAATGDEKMPFKGGGKIEIAVLAIGNSAIAGNSTKLSTTVATATNIKEIKP